jgi:hypothetical protein
MSLQTNPTFERIEELGKTNEALRRGVDLLVDLNAIDAFLSVSLRAIADMLETPSAYFWNAKKDEWELHLRYENGIITRETASGDYQLYKPVRYDRSEWW